MNKTFENHQAPELFVISPLITSAHAFTASLQTACEAGHIAAILLRFSDASSRDVTPLVLSAQRAGAAAILSFTELSVEQSLMRVRETGAEGLHTTQDLANQDPALLRALRKNCGTELTLGAGQLKARHDAMEAGEAGVDYLLFGEPDVQGQCPMLSGVLERAAWWAGLFAVPCAAYAPQLSDIPAIVSTRCEFIALGDAIWSHPEGPKAAIEKAHEIIRALHLYETSV
jgi:thiamine-phosphate pyrophosphorylase